MIGILTRTLGYVSFLLVAGLCLATAGCSSRLAVSREYFAVVENIEDVPGQHYSPSKGQGPLYAFDLRITNPENHQAHLRLLVFELKDTESLGVKGDRISELSDLSLSRETFGWSSSPNTVFLGSPTFWIKR